MCGVCLSMYEYACVCVQMMCECALMCVGVHRCVCLCSGVCVYSCVCTGMRGCVWDEFSENLLETRVLTSASGL